MFSLLVSHLAFAFDGEFDFKKKASLTMQMTFPDYSTAHLWLQDLENPKEKRVTGLFYERGVDASKNFLGDEGVELLIFEIDCDSVPKRKVKYGKSREYINFWACHQ